MAATPKAGLRFILILISLLVAVALVLVVWLVAVPAIRGEPTPPPTWSDPVPLQTPAGTAIDLSDSGVPGIAIAQGTPNEVPYWGTMISAIDTNTMETLWSYQVTTQDSMGYSYNIAAGKLLAISSHGQLIVIDISTGHTTQMTKLDDQAVFPTIQFVNSNIVITDNSHHGMCGRHWDNLSVCAWTSEATVIGQPPWGRVYMFSQTPAPLAFSGGKWINTSAGVVDALTGAPAPFGADAQETDAFPQLHSVFYAGRDDNLIFRCVYDTDGNEETASCQRWDTASNSAVGATMSGTNFAENLAWDLPYLLISDMYQMSAYSWDTGEQVWTQQLDGMDAVAVGDNLFFGYQGSSDDGRSWSVEYNPSYLVAADTGKILWTGGLAGVLGISQDVVYFYTFPDNSANGQVIAQDLNSRSKHPAWILDGPAPDTVLTMIDNRILAVSSSQQQIWSLTV